MKETIQIDIVSDVSCPWCVIGYSSIMQAIGRLTPKVECEISWKPFELNPKMSAEGQQLEAHLNEKYGSSHAEMEQTKNMITERGEALGFEFNFKEDGRIYNTFNAHRLLFWARQFNKQTELKLALFGLYFTEGGNPDKLEDMLGVVTKVGLSADEARKIIESDQYAKEIREEEAKYQAMGVNMVPTFIINNKYVITGGMPVENFVEKLEQIVEAG